MYRLLNNSYGADSIAVLRLTDNVSIPFDPANVDFQEYQRWLAEGNEPLPADAPTE